MITNQSQPKVCIEDILFIDIETYSEQDIKKVGTVKYTEDCEVMLIGFKLGNRYDVWDFQDNVSIPTWVFKHINSGGKVCAHNMLFDFLAISKHVFSIKLTQLIDTMAMCGSAGLPLDLDRAAKELGVPPNQQKLKDGKRLIKLFCIPRKPTKYNPSTRVLPQDAPDDWALFKEEYLRLDIESMIEVYKRLPKLTDREWRVWQDTQTVNLSGVPIDTEACELIINKLDALIDDESTRFIRMTGIFPSQRAKVLDWVHSQGVKIPNLQAATVQATINDPNVPANVREALECRANTTHMSFSKFPKMLDTCSSDGVVRGTLIYHVAGTGRFGGRLIQTQNLTKGNIETNEAVQRIKDGEFSVELVKSAVRGMIYLPEGMSIADYSGIEARIVQLMAQDYEALEVFVSGKDPYVWMATKIYGVKYEEVDDKQRFTGKQAILGLGFQMSAKKFIAMVESYGETISKTEADIAVKIYRDTHKKLVRLWGAMNKGAIMALERPGKTIKVNKYVSFTFEGKFLFMHLPSGRSITYHLPRIEFTSWGDRTFSYMSMNEKNQYVRTHTYGGKLTENLVQGVARDLLVDAITRILDDGFRIITHVHDEIVVAGMTELDSIIKLMCELPDWAEGLPLTAEGFTSLRFKKG